MDTHLSYMLHSVIGAAHELMTSVRDFNIKYLAQSWRPFWALKDINISFLCSFITTQKKYLVLINFLFCRDIYQMGQ